MKVHFYTSPDSRTAHARDVAVVPRVGETVVWHGLDGHNDAVSPRFKVVDVTHVYEDRQWYSERPDFGDRTCVIMMKS